IVLASSNLVVGNGFPAVIDNLEYDAPVAVPPPDTTPPAITITSPAANEIVRGALPGIISVDVAATILEEALRSVTISINGGSAFPAYYFSATPTNNRVFATVNGSNGLVSGTNTITIVATDFSNNSKTASRQFTYVIQPTPPPSTV